MRELEAMEGGRRGEGKRITIRGVRRRKEGVAGAQSGVEEERLLLVLARRISVGLGHGRRARHAAGGYKEEGDIRIGGERAGRVRTSEGRVGKDYRA